MRGDVCSRCVAIVSDGVVNAAERVFALLARRGRGLMQLLPPRLSEDDARAWIESLAEQVAEFSRNEYALVVVVDARGPRRIRQRSSTLSQRSACRPSRRSRLAEDDADGVGAFVRAATTARSSPRR